MTDDSAPVSARIAFFPEGTSPLRERRRRLFLVVWMVVSVALIWPIHPWAASMAPLLVFGLPFSLVWFLGLLAVMFFATLWLFLGDEGTEDEA